MVIQLRQLPVNPEFDEGRTRARIFGEVATGMYPGATWGTVEPHMAGDWQAVRGNSPLTWADVRGSAHASWQVAKLQAEGLLCDDAPVFKAA
jgi:hypothetical protein